MNIITLSIILLFITGCSSTSIDTSPVTTIKSQKVENENLNLFKKIRKIFPSNNFLINKENETIIIRMLNKGIFKTNSAIINKETKDTINQLSYILKDYPEKEIVIEGHTDSTGRHETNEALSGLRAQSVSNILISNDIKNRIYIVGYGETKPISSNFTKSGREANRRIEVIIKNGSIR